MSKWTELLDQLIAGEADEPPPYMRSLGLPYPKGWEPGRVWLEWDVNPEMFHEGKALFGGFIAALADHALSGTTISVLTDGEDFTTSDLRVSYFRPISEGTLQKTESSLRWPPPPK